MFTYVNFSHLNFFKTSCLFSPWKLKKIQRQNYHPESWKKGIPAEIIAPNRLSELTVSPALRGLLERENFVFLKNS